MLMALGRSENGVTQGVEEDGGERSREDITQQRIIIIIIIIKPFLFLSLFSNFGLTKSFLNFVD